MEDRETAAGAGKTLTEREPVDVPPSQVTVKTAATVAVVVLGVALVAYLVVHSLLAITVTVAAGLLAVALNRPVEFLQRRGLGRKTSVAVVMAGVFLVLAGLGWLVVPTAVNQVEELVERWPELYRSLRSSQLFASVDKSVDVDRRVEELQTRGTLEVGKLALGALGGAAAAVVAFVTVLFLVIFMLVFGGRVVRGVLAESLPLHRERYERVLGKIYRSVGGYLSGLGMIAALNATLMAAFLAILRVPFFLPLAIISGVGSLIPLLGATVSGIVIAAVALASKGLWAGVAAGLYVIAYQQFENHAVVPLVYERTVEVNPLVTLLGIIFLTELAGVVGAFLAVPLIAAAQIVLRELFLLRRERLNLPLEGDVARTRNRRPFWRRRLA